MMKWAAAALFALLLAFVVIHDVGVSRHAAARVAELTEYARSEAVRADSLEGLARRHELRADSLSKAVNERVRGVVERVVEVRKQAVPDSCAPLVAPRDSLIDEVLAIADARQQENEELRHANTILRESLSGYRAANDSLGLALKVPAPVQSVGLGAACGVGPRGLDCVVGVAVRVDPVALLRRIF